MGDPPANMFFDTEHSSVNVCIDLVLVVFFLLTQPFRAHVPMDRTVAMRTWSVLANAIDEIHNRNASKLSFEELYRNAYNLVLHKHGTLLYDGVTEKLSSHLLETVTRLAETPDSSLLEEIASTWNEHQVSFWIAHSRVFIANIPFSQSTPRTGHNDYGARYSYVHGPNLHSTTAPETSLRAWPSSL